MRSRSRTPQWDHVAFVESDSDPGREWEISRHVGTQRLGCSCPSYRFKKGEKTCRHIAAWLQSQAQRFAYVPPASVRPPVQASTTTTRVSIDGVGFNVRAPRAVSFAADDL